MFLLRSRISMPKGIINKSAAFNVCWIQTILILSIKVIIVGYYYNSVSVHHSIQTVKHG